MQDVFQKDESKWREILTSCFHKSKKFSSSNELYQSSLNIILLSTESVSRSAIFCVQDVSNTIPLSSSFEFVFTAWLHVLLQYSDQNIISKFRSWPLGQTSCRCFLVEIEWFLKITDVSVQNFRLNYCSLLFFKIAVSIRKWKWESKCYFEIYF